MLAPCFWLLGCHLSKAVVSRKCLKTMLGGLLLDILSSDIPKKNNLRMRWLFENDGREINIEQFAVGFDQNRQADSQKGKLKVMKCQISLNALP